MGDSWVLVGGGVSTSWGNAKAKVGVAGQEIRSGSGVRALAKT